MTGPTRRSLPIRSGIAIIVAAILALAPPTVHIVLPVQPTHAAGSAAPAAPVFPGLLLGASTITVPKPANFVYGCNVAASAQPAKAAGTTLAAGTAIHNVDGCGQALLYLNAPASGHFQATFAVADAATGTTAGLRLFLLGAGGYELRTLILQATKGKAQPVDLDVAGGVTLALTFPTSTESYVYNIKLTGTAHARAATPLTGGGLPAGGTPVAASAMQLTCNVSRSTTSSTVTQVTVPMTGSLQMEGCGKVSVSIPANAQGALALRYGENDSTNYSSLPAQVGLRVLDATGHLLRKAIGLTYLGSGLQPLWVNVQGGSTVTFTLDGGNTNPQLAVAGISFLPAPVAPHHNPDRQDFGSPSGAPIAISPDAVVGICNANLGTSDTTVTHQPLLRDTYLSVHGCGVAELIMTGAHGRFTTKFGIDDSSIDKTLTAHLIVLDQNSHPIATSSATAQLGQPAVTLSATIDNASIVQISFNGNASGDLYGFQLSGHATLYDRIFPPSEPPVSTMGGTAINPLLMSVSCNVHPTTQDMELIHQVALEQWSLYFNGCGAAVLNLASLPGPHRTFSALYGIALQDPRVLIAHIQFTVLDAKGGTVRKATFVARAGYGPRRAAISLAGGAKLQLTIIDQPLVLFALTTA
ncbi:MAG TPA: hypothetical protein VHB98_09315 [Chloroflexota bacterium]|nr:hypothetical protein [Chloroflexota bacterium]